MGRGKDITGARSGKLTAIKDIGADKQRYRIWLCKCDCGNTTKVRAASIISGNTSACGCLTGKGEHYKLSYGESSFNILYRQYKYAAKTKGREFSISKEEFRELTSQDCYYCGGKPVQIRKVLSDNGHYVYNGIDRVDNSIGYILSNCITCCATCNYWKKAGTKEELLDHALRICEHNMETSLV